MGFSCRRGIVFAVSLGAIWSACSDGGDDFNPAPPAAAPTQSARMDGQWVCTQSEHVSGVYVDTSAAYWEPSESGVHVCSPYGSPMTNLVPLISCAAAYPFLPGEVVEIGLVQVDAGAEKPHWCFEWRRNLTTGESYLEDDFEARWGVRCDWYANGVSFAELSRPLCVIDYNLGYDFRHTGPITELPIWANYGLRLAEIAPGVLEGYETAAFQGRAGTAVAGYTYRVRFEKASSRQPEWVRFTAPR